MNAPADYHHRGPGLSVDARLVPWDTQAFGYPVATITALEVTDETQAGTECSGLEAWRDGLGVGLASCRLPHGRLRESMFLETRGFRFIEMTLQPVLENLGRHPLAPSLLTVATAAPGDLPALRAIAECAFGHERYHVDPRLDPRLADLRYGRWVANAAGDGRQRLYKVSDSERLVALFVIEETGPGAVYWHLNAVDPRWQGRGYGTASWLAMLHHHRSRGVERVTTTISARNVTVLNLYARLGFRFAPPQMTFHWLREGRA